MNLSSNQKLFIQDKEVSGVQDKDMVRRKDAQEKGEF